MTAPAGLLGAWRAWEQRPGETMTARWLEAVLAEAAAAGPVRSATAIRHMISERRRAGMTVDQALAAIWPEPTPAPTSTFPAAPRPDPLAEAKSFLNRDRPANRAASRRPAGPRPGVRPGRFVAMVADVDQLLAPAGAADLSGGLEHAGQLVEAARRLAPGSEPAIWISAGTLDLAALIAAVGEAGWQTSEWGASTVLEDPAGRASITPIIGPPLAGLPTSEILEVLGELERAVGFTWTLSGASTLRNLLRSTQGRAQPIGVPHPHPELTPAWVTPAWSIPAHRWITPEPPRAPWRRAFDRNGAYLAAAGGLAVPDGPWQRGWVPLEPGGESSRPVGYWLLDRAELAALIDPLLPNPFDRRSAEPAAWYTTPLAQLAADLAGEAGLPLTVHEVWWADGRRKPFDGLVDRVKAARGHLASQPVALEVLKQGYSQLIADLEYGPQPGHKMWRPEWRRAVLDRHAANTFRAIAKIAACPLELAHIDHVVYPLDSPDEIPPGMKLGTGIGQWKPAGEPEPVVVTPEHGVEAERCCRACEVTRRSTEIRCWCCGRPGEKGLLSTPAPGGVYSFVGPEPVR